MHTLVVPPSERCLRNFINQKFITGGVFNQVQPAVDNEVGPIIQAIIADVVSGDETGSGSGSRPPTSAVTAESDSFLTSDLFQGADQLFTNAVINGATEALFDGGLDSIVDAIVGKKRKRK